LSSPSMSNSSSGKDIKEDKKYILQDELALVIALLTVKICQPSHEFTFGDGMSFIPYPLELTPVV
jgi:hypothetical protein